MNPRAASALLATVAAGALTLAGCGQQPATPAGAPATDRVSVVTTTDMYAAVASAVAGDKAGVTVTVTAIIKNPDTNPHQYEATPADGATVAGAKVLVANGGGYDDFATKLVAATDTKPSVIDVSELSGLKAATPAGEEFNEHVWYHLPTVAKLADQLALELGKVDPADAATFTGNADAFKTRLAGLTAKLDQIKAVHAGNRVAITEPVPLYLAQAAGLQNATPEEFSEAVEAGNDPPAAVLNETLELFRTNPVKALLANPQVENASTRQIEQAARSAGVPVVSVTETLPAGTTDYVTWMGGQIDQLATALDKR